MKKAPKKTQRQLRLSDETWRRLELIAVRENLSHGGNPSRARAVAWLAGEAVPAPAPETTAKESV